MNWRAVDDYAQSVCDRTMHWQRCTHWKANLMLVLGTAGAMGWALRQAAWVLFFATPGDSVASQLALTAITMSWPHFALACGIAAWGGAARFLHELKESEKAFSVVTGLGHMFVSQFAGLLAYLLALYWTLPTPLALFVCGLSGWGGAKTIARFDRAMHRRVHGK